MYELHRVTLGDVEGQGYAFKKKTAFGKAHMGIFFPDSAEDAEKLRDAGEITFNGAVYSGRRVRERSLDVAVIEITSTRMGERVDFEATDNPEPVRQTSVGEAE